MPSAEHQPGGQPEQPTRPEQEVTPYYRAARFTAEHAAGQAYFAVQDAIFTAEACDLSAYRLQLNRVSHGPAPTPGNPRQRMARRPLPARDTALTVTLVIP